jgi:hypothetical protein
VINQSWDANGNSFNLVDSIGLMVYTGATSLDWATSYTNGPDQGAGNNFNNFSSLVSNLKTKFTFIPV